MGGSYLEEPKLVRRLVRPDYQGLDVADVGVSASDGKCYSRSKVRKRGKEIAVAAGTQDFRLT